MAAKFRDAVEWVVGQLAGDATLTGLGMTGVYFYNAPEGQNFPYLILQKQTDAKTDRLGAVAFERHWMAVKAVDNITDGGDRARQLIDRVEALLGHQSPTLDNGAAMLIDPSTGFEYQESESGNQIYTHVGSVFTLWLR